MAPKAKETHFLSTNSKGDTPLTFSFIVRISNVTRLAIKRGNKPMVDLIIDYCIVSTVRKNRYEFVQAIPLLAQRSWCFNRCIGFQIGDRKIASAWYVAPFYLYLELMNLERCNFAKDLVVMGDETEIKRERWRNYFSDYKLDLSDPMISSFILPLPGLLEKETCQGCTWIITGVEQPLHVMTKYQLKDALDSDTMRILLRYKWDSYGREIFLKQFFFYLLFAVVFSIDMILFAHEDISMSLNELYFHTSTAYVSVNIRPWNR